MIRNEIIRDRGTESGRNRNGSTIQDTELVRAYDDKRRALRRKNDAGNVRKRGRPKIRWLDRVRGDIKEKGLSGRECTTELHNDIVEHRLTKKWD